MTELGIDGIVEAALIGHASGASVYAAKRSSGELVALKVLRRLLASDEERATFAKQVDALRQVRDLTGLVAILDAGITVHGEPFLVLPLLSESAQDRLDKQGPIEPTEAVAIITPAAQAVASLHRQGLLHLNLKPANLLFDEGGDVLLADVGISLLGNDATSSGSWLEGSPVWAAPEAFASDRPTARTDVYGLGACLLALISGQPPFPTAGATNPLQLIDRIRTDEPPALRGLNAPEVVVDAIRHAIRSRRHD